MIVLSIQAWPRKKWLGSIEIVKKENLGGDLRQYEARFHSDAERPHMVTATAIIKHERKAGWKPLVAESVQALLVDAALEAAEKEAG